MEEKLEKALKTSKQGICIILILSIVVNVLGAINAKSILNYIENYWVNLLYMIGLIIGLVLYKKEKYCQGAEVVQWTALGNIIVQFVNFIAYYIITKLVVLNINTLLIGMIIPIILIIESLKVIRGVDGEERSKKITAIAVVAIICISILQVVYIYSSMNQIDSITSPGLTDDKTNEEAVNGENTEKQKRVLVEGWKYTSDKVIITQDMVKEVEWATTKAEIDGEIGIKFYIEDKKLYYEHEGKVTQVKSIKGKAKSVAETIGGGTMVIDVLTEDGKVWRASAFNAEDVDSFEAISELESYNIKRLATLHFEELVDLIYYETPEGKLIDFDGFTIQEKSSNLLDSYGIDICLEIGVDGRLGYFNGEAIAKNFKVIKTKEGENINAKKIYAYIKGDGIIRYIVVTDRNELFEMSVGIENGNLEVNNLAQNKTVSNVICYVENTKYIAEFTMSDNTVITKEIGYVENEFCDYYNVETHETIELE